MISSNACRCSRSRRLSSSEMWRFQRGKSAARRPDDMVHAARAPQSRRSERGLAAAARSMRRPADAGRRAAPRSPPPAGRPRRHPGRSSGSCRKGFCPGPEVPPPRRRLTPHARTHAVCADAGRLVNDTRGRPEALRGARRPLGGVAASRWLSPGCLGDRTAAASSCLPAGLCFLCFFTLLFVVFLGLPPFSSSRGRGPAPHGVAARPPSASGRERDGDGSRRR